MGVLGCGGGGTLTIAQACSGSVRVPGMASSPAQFARFSTGLPPEARIAVFMRRMSARSIRAVDDTVMLAPGGRMTS